MWRSLRVLGGRVVPTGRLLRNRVRAVPHVYPFDHPHRRAPMDMKDLLGGKGANLAEMTSVLGLPVPPGFTLTTDACRAYLASGWPDGPKLEKQFLSRGTNMVDLS